MEFLLLSLQLTHIHKISDEIQIKPSVIMRVVQKNPDISLRKPTRDREVKPSINQHFAMADLQYSLRSAHNGSNVARDDKALCSYGH